MPKHAVLIFLVVAGCSYRGKSRSIAVADLGNPEATRIFNYMTTRDGKHETTSDSLLDEAVIASYTQAQVCFDLTIRSELYVDLHPSQWEVELNGNRAEAFVTAERSSNVYTSTETSQEVVLEKTTRRGTTTITAPVEREVIRGQAVRQARVCAPTPSNRKLELRIVLPSGSQSLPNWGQVFEWQIRA
jgi:hypothetical protein